MKKQLGRTGRKALVEECHCERCKYNWWPKVDPASGKQIDPKTCPSCNNPYWRTSVVRKSVSEARKK